jgi:hypothetical protein
MSKFSSVLIVSQQFFTCIALGVADLSFSPIFIPTANADKMGTTQATFLQHNDTTKSINL